MKFSFLPYVNEDLRELNDMVFSLYDEDEHGEVITGEKIANTVATLTEQPDRGGVVIFRFDTEIVGYAIVIPFWSNEYGGTVAVIDEVYVKPVWRKQGCLRQFIDFLCDNHHNGIVAVQVSVTPINVTAAKCYSTIDFKNSGSTVWIRMVTS